MKFTYDGQILEIENYKKVIYLDKEMIKTLGIIVEGNDLKIIKIDGYVLWIKGTIKKMEIGKYEN